MHTRIKLSVIGILLPALTAGLALPLPAFADTTIKIGGIGSYLGIMEQLGREFEKRQRHVKVQVLPSMGSTVGIRSVGQGALDVGLSGRPLKEGEHKPGIDAVEIARSPLVFVTERNNRTAGITTHELEGILNGRITAWGDGTPIRLILRPEKDCMTADLKGISPSMSQSVSTALKREGTLFALSDQENVRIAMKMPGSFGVSTLVQVRAENIPLRVLAFNGVRPALRSVANGSYRLYKSLYLVTAPSRTSAPVRDFLAFVQSREGQRILLNAGALPVTHPAPH